MDEDSINLISFRQVEINRKYGGDLSYQRDRVVNEIRFFMAQSACSMLETGRRLILLKENELHGDFLKIIDEEFNLSIRTAQRMMQSAVKFLNLGKKNAQTLASLGSSKLFELITTDDEELAELAEGGTVVGLALDDIDKMSVRELKKALRTAREDSSAKDMVIADKNNKIDSLSVTAEKERLQLKSRTEEEVVMEKFHNTWGSVSGSIQGSLYHAYQIINQALDEQKLPRTFQQKMLLDVCEYRDLLIEMINLLPESADPVDTTWLTDNSQETQVND